MNQTSGIRVLIPSGAGAPGFAGILRCLREDATIQVITGDMQESPYGKSLADGFYQVPASSANNYIEKILEICKKEAIQAVLPITTGELLPLVKHQSLFESEGIQLVISKTESLEIANNKGNLYKFIRENCPQIPIPEFAIVRTKVEFKQAVEILLNQFPEACFKPVVGNGSRGFGRVVKNVTSDFLSAKAGVMPLLLEEWLLRFPEILPVELLVSAYLPGKEYSVDVLAEHGKTLLCIPRTRDKMVGGISVAGTFVNDLSIKAFSMRLVQALELNGPIGLQWKEDVQGMPHLLEINPRLQGTTSAALFAGANIPLLAVYQALGLEMKINTLQIQWGGKFGRHWEDDQL